MRTSRYITALMAVAMILILLPCLAGNAGKSIAEPVKRPESEEHAIQYTDPASIALISKENVIAACKAVYDEYRDTIYERKNELAEGQITMGDITMRVNMQIIGDPDENGYPMIIALHGGGSSDTPAINDSQWEQMKVYYRDAVTSAVYVTPRGIRDTWDTHFNPESYSFYNRIIEDAVAFDNVDPDRVYLLGFSAGGDGVYAISTRMADRFAAVNMSAGHPNGISIVNLYHLPIILQVGEDDDAYNRNTVTAEYDALLDQAAVTYGDGYIHTTMVHIGKPHNFFDNGTDEQEVASDVKTWLETGDGGTRITDTNAVRLTGSYTRDANPTRVVWDIATNAPGRGINAYYWLGRSADLDRGIVVANYNSETNRVTVESCTAGCGTLKIYLTASMADLFSPVTVDFCGTVSRIMVAPSLSVMRATVAERGDPEMVYAAVIEVDVATGAVVGTGEE